MWLDGIEITAGLREADKIGSPEAVNNTSHPDLWRSVEDIRFCSMGRRKATLS